MKPNNQTISKIKMPSIGMERNLVHHYGMDYDEERCECCPYGYHIDLDFVPFTKKMLSREGDVTRLQELKDKWRSERQSMDKLLGVESIAPKIWDVNATISRASTDVWKSAKKLFDLDTSIGKTIKNGNLKTGSSSTDLIFENGLSEAVTDFEEALLRTRPQSKILSYEIPDTQKFHTFPRIKAPVLRDPVTGSSAITASSLFSNRGSSSNTSTSFSTVIMKDSFTKFSSRELNKKSDDSLIGEMDSIYSRTTQQKEQDQGRDLKDVLQDLENQVKLIPELEVKVTLLMEEKRQLMKLLEVEKQKTAKNLQNLATQSSLQNDKGVTNGMTPVVPPRRKTRDASVGMIIMTRDVGVSHICPRTRTIGVGGSSDLSNWDRIVRGDSISPTGSTSGTLKRRVRTFEVGVQASDYEFGDSKSNVPVLQIVERVDRGAQTEVESKEVSSEKSSTYSRKKHTGTLVKPSTSDTGVSHKPSVRDVGITATQPDDSAKKEKVRTKHVGVSASIDSDPAFQERSTVKSTRTSGVNTEKLRTHTIGCNTTAKKSFEEDTIPQASKSKLFSIDDEYNPEPSSRSSSRSSVSPPRPFPVTSITSAFNTSSAPTTSTWSAGATRTGSTPALSLSPIETKIQSRIPRYQPSPSSSPVLSPSKPTAKSILSTSPDRSESPILGSFSTSPVSTSQAEALPSSSMSLPSLIKKPSYQRSDTYTKEMYMPDRQIVGTLEPLEEDEREGPRSSSASSSSGISSERQKEERVKVHPSTEMQGALKVLNDALLRGKTTQQVTTAISIILHEWFRVAGTKSANPAQVEDYLDSFEIFSPQLLRYIVNMPDGNGNTALHYAVSHGNFDVVSILLDSKVCDPNKANKAGYTSIMLVALAKITCDTHRQVVRRLFSSGDVNIKAAQHGQTALMLGASHGRFDTIRLLIEAGADINIQDEDGSTALMCAAEHGHLQIAKFLLAQPDCDLNITDNDGSTAFTIAMEGGFKDIGVLLYAQMHFGRSSTSPNGSSNPQQKSRSTTPSSQNSTSNSSSAHTSPLVAKRQHFDSSLFSPKK